MNNTTDEIAVKGMQEFFSSSVFFKFGLSKSIIAGISFILGLVQSILLIVFVVKNPESFDSASSTISFPASVSTSFVSIVLIWLVYIFAKKGKRVNVPFIIYYVLNLIGLISLFVSLIFLVIGIFGCFGYLAFADLNESVIFIAVILTIFVTLLLFIAYRGIYQLFVYKASKDMRYAFTKGTRKVRGLKTIKVFSLISIFVYLLYVALFIITLVSFKETLASYDVRIATILGSSFIYFLLFTSFGFGVANAIVNYLFVKRFDTFVDELAIRTAPPTSDAIIDATDF